VHGHRVSGLPSKLGSLKGFHEYLLHFVPCRISRRSPTASGEDMFACLPGGISAPVPTGTQLENL
jgi:hypothetical protein